MRLVMKALLAILATATTLGAAAQSNPYPSKQVRIIVPLPPGADTDAMARLLAGWYERRMAQPFVVENHPGGNQGIGVDAVLKAPADGYTLLFTASILSYLPAIVKSTPFDPLKDLKAIAPIAGNGFVLVVNPSVPAKTSQEFIAYVNANPGHVNYATIGTFPVPEVAQLAAKSNFKWVYIPYQGGAQAYNAVVAGDAQFAVGSPFQSIGLAEAGKLRIIGYTGARRHPLLPNTPTLSESVAPDIVGGPWFGLFASSAVATDVINKLNAEAREMSKDTDFRARIDKMGYADVYNFDAEESQRFYEKTGRSASDIYHRLGITPQ